MKTGLIVEDHPSAQVWLRAAMEMAFPGIQCTLAATIESAHAVLDAHMPELALIDLNLPDGSGVTLLERIQLQSPATVSVVATIYDDDDHLFPALRAGAKGYILKEQPCEEISALLKGIHNGIPPLSPAISHRLLNFFANVPVETPSHPTLTEREREVLSIIARGGTVNEAATHLGVSRNTVATQVKSIYNKLNISSRAEAAMMASKIGILSSS